ncbi:unnamed protein product [Vitrella brassicaformis CCMP3155]|uniref:Uncharacterized protein n=1 Tax=Vitrella brassicaformis (strain CCMP3155) TaxID=1169540 RepID=A0A0G4EI16_VITBC|nr:unnamed protein product [Vitrella brassicaformis CCMP3155]|eukprot:CEL95628.1 unnamed protein product [Vitrella brassicaformis CCMP3155]
MVFDGLLGFKVEPLTGFCCGQSLAAGVTWIASLDMADAFFSVLGSSGIIVFEEYAEGNGPVAEGISLLLAAVRFTLSLLCLVAVFRNTSRHAEIFRSDRRLTPVQTYFFYYVTCIVVDTIWLAVWMAIVCDEARAGLEAEGKKLFAHHSQRASAGFAEACTVVRTTIFALLVGNVFIGGYFAYVVWSYVQLFEKDIGNPNDSQHAVEAHIYGSEMSGAPADSFETVPYSYTPPPLHSQRIQYQLVKSDPDTADIDETTDIPLSPPLSSDDKWAGSFSTQSTRSSIDVEMAGGDENSINETVGWRGGRPPFASLMASGGSDGGSPNGRRGDDTCLLDV